MKKDKTVKLHALTFEYSVWNSDDIEWFWITDKIIFNQMMTTIWVLNSKLKNECISHRSKWNRITNIC